MTCLAIKQGQEQGRAGTHPVLRKAAARLDRAGVGDVFWRHPVGPGGRGRRVLAPPGWTGRAWATCFGAARLDRAGRAGARCSCGYTSTYSSYFYHFDRLWPGPIAIALDHEVPEALNGRT
jgi:hypothetical protein